MTSIKGPDFEDSTDVAIIGMAGRFPGAKNIDEFWRNLLDGVESVTQFSDEELLKAGVEPAALKDPNYVKAGAILGDIEGFDAPFFGLTPREAQILDPQHRLFLEVAWNVIESAGYDPTTYDGSIGVFAGVGLSTYLLNNLYPNRDLWESVGELPIILGNDKDSLTTRVAYLMNMTGPCCTIQTYCSTSLVAVGIACESLLSGESDMALAGGVLVTVPQKAGYYYQEGGIASPDARCRAFDAKAKGSPLGNGVAVILLKRLEDAIAGGDTIYAVIKGWAINNDGALRTGYTAPGLRGQASVILEALANAEVDAESIGYIEAHGTGTALGDAVEFAAMVKAFSKHTDKKGFCAVGSVKTNVGHLDRAAGTTSLIKTALALKHKLIPPSLNYEEPNPEIDFSNTSFYINTELREWTTSNGLPRRAGVSSFGMGGTNAHIIMEEAPRIPFTEPLSPYQLLLLSAKTATALDSATGNLYEHLQKNPDINMADVAYTLQAGRKAFEHRRILVCKGRDDALQALEEGNAGRLLNSVQPTQERPIVFMFPGVGDHYVGMARELYQHVLVFRETVDFCCDFLRPILGLDLRDVLYPGEDTNTSAQGIDLRQMLGRGRVPGSATRERLNQTEIVQPAVFVIEYALSQLLQSWGIVPDTLIGYSLGEYAAACVAGVLSLEDTLTLVTRRAQMIQQLPKGDMLTVSLSEAKVRPFLNEQVCLAVVNGPSTCVLSGPPASLASLEQQLVDKGITYRRLETSHAFHSTMMEPIVAEFTTLVQTVQLNRPQIPYLSNVTGRRITDEEATDPTYWARHLCQTVRFGDGLVELLSNRQQILIEVGPGQSLGSFAKQHPDCSRQQLSQILPTLRYAYDRHSDVAFFLGTLGKLWLAGFEIDWSGFYGKERRQRIPLPTYPFEHQRYWINPPADVTVTSPRQQATTGKKVDIADWFYEPLWEASALPEVNGEIGGPWLIFEDSLGWGAAIGNHLSQYGVPVVRVQVGEAFTQVSPDSFTIRPDAPADYHALLAALKRSGRIPSQIAHIWSLGIPEDHLINGTAFPTAQRVGFYSLLYFTHALTEQSAIQSVRITVLTNNTQPVGDGSIHPEKATILGLCRVIPQEYQGIRCQAVDIMLTTGGGGVEDPLAAQLAAELVTPVTDVTVAYRAGIRYVQRFVPKTLTAEPSVGQLRPGGVYLITGGLGKIGFTLAEYLARRLQAKLVLISRSGLPPCETWDNWLVGHPDKDPTSRKIQKIRTLEALGAEVLVMSADVSNEEQMQAVVDQTYERFGKLSAVIHTAGLTGLDAFPPVQNTDRAICEAHFLPKAYGLYVLDKVLQGKNIDFCLLFSSLSSVLGGLGFAAYTAANSFMDAYAHAHNRIYPSTWISVGWDTWKADIQAPDLPFSATVAEFAMTPEEGMQAFALAVASGATQLVNSTGDLDARIRQWVTLEVLTTETTAIQASHSRPDLSTDYVPASNEYEKRIAAIWQDVLGIDQIGIHDNFFDLGGNSLIGLQIVSRIKKAFDSQISVIVLFEAPTVSALAKYLRPDTAPDEGEKAQEAALVERRRKARQSVDNQGVAIIGVTGRFPGAKTVDQLWQNLCNGVESITSFTDKELLASGLDPKLINDPNYVKARPILDGIELFDAAFFGYSPREAEIMDPQHRLFLECAWESLELAGYDPERYKGLIGVFAGANISTYLLSWIANPQIAQSVNSYQAVISSDKDSLTTTASYKMNLRGPSFAVQTFCSTSLVATHLACQSLLNGECDIALAGGVSIRVPHRQGYVYQEGGMDSPDGHCRTFDAQARGTLFGDGVGVVVLKRLEDALADGDTIHAVIKGSAVNNDGSLKVGYTAPSVVGQAEAVSMALEHAGINPETIGYIEAHGTATELGDPVEVASLTQTFRKYTDRKGYCAIGSVKTNMGHLDRAAGVTGLIKAALAVKRGLIPPSLHFERPNPEIDFENSPFYVNTKLLEWPCQNGMPRRAGVNSLGMGGTNAHVIVEEPPERPPSGPSRPWQLLLLSARTESALDMATVNLAHYLRQNPDANLADIAYTLQVGRRGFEHRRMVVGQGIADTLEMLESANPHQVLTHYQPAINRPIAFMFPGVGDHYLQMAKEYYEEEIVFRDIVEQCCRILHPYLRIKLRDLLYPSDESSVPETDRDGGMDLRAMLGRGGQELSPAAKKLSETSIAQPVVFVIEYALARLLMSWGVRPQAMVGYSLGEYVAACISGVLSLKDALKLVAERARMIQSLPAGSMLAVSLSEEAVRPLLSEEISLAIHNGKTSCVLAGSPEGAAQLEAQLTERGIACRPLNTTHAFHCSTMASLAKPLTELAQTVKLNPPRIPYISNVTGTWITAKQATEPGYWAEHMCQPVRFFDTLTELLKDKDRILLEVGPGQSLASFAKQHPACTREQIRLILPTMRFAHDHQSDLPFLLETLGKLWLLGFEPDWSGFYETEQRHRTPVPPYPFERQRYWVESSQKHWGGQVTVEQARTPAEAIGALPRQEVTNWFYLPTWKQVAPQAPQLPDEKINGNTCWLLFADTWGLGAQIAAWLTEHKQHVVVVQPGSSFKKLGESQYVVRPQLRADYATVLNELHQRGLEPAKIVHLWSVTDGESVSGGDDFLERMLDLGLYSLMCLAQVVDDLNLASCEISIVSSQLQAVTSDERPCPEKATVIGPCRVIPLEYSNITCRCVDVALATPGSWQAEALLMNLLGVLTTGVDGVIMALRGHQCWARSFEPISLPPVCGQKSPRLRSDGVYLVTGGLGGIGLAMAEHLARTLRAKLILTSRSGLPSRAEWAKILATQDDKDGIGRKIRRVQHLEELGAEVLVVAADVANKAQMQAAVQQSVARFGTIHGVFHAAGVPGMGLIQLKTPEMAAEVLAPKVKGTLVLEQVLQEQAIELDFLVLFSSVTSVTGGGPGQIDYCAANAFMDAYAQRCVGSKRLTTSIDWGEWQWNAWEEGLAGFGDEVQIFFRENRKRLGITFEEGSDALERILSRRLPRVVVSTQDFHKVVELSKHFTITSIRNWGCKPGETRSKHPRPVLGASYVAPRDESERKIATVWGDILGISEIGINDNFFELGGNSLIGLDLVRRLQEVLNMERIPARALYEAPTVGALAKFLDQDQGSKVVIDQRYSRGEKRRQRSEQRKQRLRTGKRQDTRGL